MAVKATTFEPNAAFAFYYKGLVLSRMGCGERALTSFKEALVAELEQDVPDGQSLRLFRDKIREVEKALFPPPPPPRSVSTAPGDFAEGRNPTMRFTCLQKKGDTAS